MNEINLNLENFSSNTVYLKILAFFLGIVYFFSIPLEKNTNFNLFLACFLSFPLILFSLFNIIETTILKDYKRSSISFFLFVLSLLFILQQDTVVKIFDIIFFKDIDLKKSIFLYISFLTNIINALLVVSMCIFIIVLLSEYVFSGFLYSVLKKKYDLKFLRIYAFLFVIFLSLDRIFSMILDGGLEVFE